MWKVFLYFIGLYTIGQTQGTAQAMITNAETALNLLAQTASSKYSRRCGEECNAKIFDECDIYSPEMQCYPQFPTPSYCSKKGGFLNYQHAAGRCSLGSACNSQEEKELMCSMATLFGEDTIKHSPDSPIQFQYAGFYNGFRTIFPYVHQPFNEPAENKQCSDYDPRFRPWYVGAVTGGKNIVLIIDVSGSMLQLERDQIARSASIAVIETLGQQDYFTLVFFSNSVNVWNGKLQRANDSNKKSAIKNIEALNFGGSTNFEIAFDKAFEIFKVSEDQELNNPCAQNIILFLTDGDPTKGVGSAQDAKEQLDKGTITESAFEQQKLSDEKKLINHINSLNISSRNVTMFTYSLGSNASVRLPQQIACENNGIWYKIQDGGKANLKTHMRSYYTYLTKGLEQNKIVWSDEYLDSVTNKTFITAAKAMYTQVASSQQLLGVVGVDLLVEQLEGFSDYAGVYSKLIAESRQCTKPSVNISPCELDSLRQETCFKTSPYPGGTDRSSMKNTCANQQGDVAFEKCPQDKTTETWYKGEEYQKYSPKDLTPCCEGGDSSILKFSILLLVLMINWVLV